MARARAFNDAGYAQHDQYDQQSEGGYCATRGAQGVLVPSASAVLPRQDIQYLHSSSRVCRARQTPPTSHYPVSPPPVIVLQRTVQAKREVARGGGVARKNVALVRCEQARHATAPSQRAAFRASLQELVCAPRTLALALEVQSPWPSRSCHRCPRIVGQKGVRAAQQIRHHAPSRETVPKLSPQDPRDRSKVRSGGASGEDGSCGEGAG